MSVPPQDTPPWITETLTEPEWRARQAAHRDRHAPFLEAQIERRARGEKDPTLDFMFEYYAYPPARLLRWTPGFGVRLAGAGAREFLRFSRFVEVPGGVALSVVRLVRRRPALQWIAELLQSTSARPPFFQCYGAHEWALVHGSPLLHPSFALRVSRDEIAARVSQGIPCTHYDAYRFFSPEAKALARWPLSADAMPRTEQPGCLHTNMDLYRWAQKLAPYAPSELLGDAFVLACEARRVDSSTCPYDLSRTGLPPLKIETDAGRRSFVAAQRAIWQAAIPIRERLIAAYSRVLPWLEGPAS